MKKFRGSQERKKWLFLKAMVLFLIFYSAFPVIGAEELTAEREFSETSVKPGAFFQVSLFLTANQEVIAPALDEDLPKGWELRPLENAGAFFKPSTSEWIWAESFVGGTTRNVTYEVAVPSNASEGFYQFSGKVSAFNLSLRPVQGEKEIFVSEKGKIPDEKGILLFPGWNFLSVPYTLQNASAEVVLKGVTYSSLLYYNAENKTWEIPETFEPLKAYWLFVEGPETQLLVQENLKKKPISGAELPASLKVYEGWNAIGYTDALDFLSAEIALKSIDRIYTSVLGPWDPKNATYLSSGHNWENGLISGKHVGTDVFEMKAYEGYWVYLIENGSLSAMWV